MNWLDWKPEKKEGLKPNKKSFEQWKTDQGKAVQKSARHYLYTEPRVLTNSERESLKMIFLQTISTGSQLHRCTDPEQAERFNNYLMHHLSANFAAGIIRDCEINTFIFQH